MKMAGPTRPRFLRLERRAKKVVSKMRELNIFAALMGNCSSFSAWLVSVILTDASTQSSPVVTPTAGTKSSEHAVHTPLRVTGLNVGQEVHLAS